MKTLIRHARVVSPDVEIEGASLLLENDRIAAVFGAGEAMPEAHVFDASQLFHFIRGVMRLLFPGQFRPQSRRSWRKFPTSLSS